MISIQSKIRKAGVYAGLILATLFAASPVIWMLTMSLRRNVEIFEVPPSLIPDKITIEPYINILNNPENLRFFFNSYFIATVVTIGSLIIAIFIGYAFSRFDFPGKKVMNLFVISTQTVPPISLLIPYFSMVVTFQIYDTYFALLFTFTALCLPYSILMMTGYFNTISEELDEAVLIDGGSRFYALWRVIVPLSIPGLVATGVYSFLLAWNEFLFALTLTKSTSMRTVPVGIAMLMGQHAFEWNKIMSMSILGSIPILIIYLFAQKYFLSGMTAGSVKQ